jgi:hypothetical protein
LLVNFAIIYCTVSSGAQVVLLQSALLSLQARSLAAFLALAERKKNTLRGARTAAAAACALRFLFPLQLAFTDIT